MSKADAIAPLLPKGRKVRFLFGDDVQRFSELSVKCGGCKHALEKKKRAEVQAGFCNIHSIMVGTTTPVLCAEFTPG